MIWLAQDYLLFELASGERVPFSAEAVSVELGGPGGESCDPELLRQATKAVFHYFQHELKRQTVTLVEFSAALEQVLRGFTLQAAAPPPAAQPTPHPTPAPTIPAPPPGAPADLQQLVAEAGGLELVFFGRLRDELRSQLRRSPRLLRFDGLRGCVKRLAGARRWSPRCRALQERIVEYLRACTAADHADRDCALVIR